MVALDQSEFWRKQVLEHYEYLEKLSHKRIYDPITADAALNFAIDQLKKNDWRRLRQFRGEKSQLKSFLSTVVSRLLNDYVKSTLKPVRIPEWVRACGSVWVKTFNLLCKEKLNIDETIGRLCNREADENGCRVEVEKAIAGILSRFTKCGKYTGEPIPIDPNDMDQINDILFQFPHLNPEEICQVLEQVAIMEALFTFLVYDQGATLDGNIQKKIALLRTNLRLSSEERVLLKTIYLEGNSVSNAGRRMNLNANQCHGRHRRLLNKIRQAIDACDLKDELKQLVREN